MGVKVIAPRSVLCQETPERQLDCLRKWTSTFRLFSASHPDMQALIKNVRGLLPVALKGTRDELRERFFANMSKRGALLLKEDIEANLEPPTSHSGVFYADGMSYEEMAQREVVRILHLLINAGEVSMEIPEH